MVILVDYYENISCLIWAEISVWITIGLNEDSVSTWAV